MLELYYLDAIDDLDIRQKQFFMNCRKAKPDWREQQFKNINEVSSLSWAVLVLTSPTLLFPPTVHVTYSP